MHYGQLVRISLGLKAYKKGKFNVSVINSANVYYIVTFVVEQVWLKKQTIRSSLRHTSCCFNKNPVLDMIRLCFERLVTTPMLHIYHLKNACHS